MIDDRYPDTVERGTAARIRADRTERLRHTNDDEWWERRPEATDEELAAAHQDPS